LALLPLFLATTILAGIVVNARPLARMKMIIIVGQTVSSGARDCINLFEFKLGSRSSAKTAIMRQFHHVLLLASKSESLKPQLMNTLAGFTTLEFTVSHIE